VSAPAPFAGELFVPRYVPMASGAWRLSVVPLSISPGYWSGPRPVADMAVLVHDRRSWMSTTPFEFESQEIGIRRASGHVLIFGLGMGWATAACACLPAVSQVTVVEKDADVIALHHRLDLFAQLPAEARAKLTVVPGDAHEYRASVPVDLLMPDIWLPLVSDGRLDEVRRMQDNVAARAVYFWGQEMEIARHLAAARRQPDETGVAATVAGFGLPLIGFGDPGYADKVVAAARRWMNGRWLGGEAPPWGQGAT
jgi:hypothetical protein